MQTISPLDQTLQEETDGIHMQILQSVNPEKKTTTSINKEQNSPQSSLPVLDLQCFQDEENLDYEPGRSIPVPPLDSDCCGSGCTPCIFDIYEQELKIAKLKTVSSISQMNVNCYTEFELIEQEDITEDVRRFRFKLPQNRLLGHKAGQHVIIRASSSTSSRDYLTRQYSVLSKPLDAGYFDLLIKLYEKGRMSSLIRNWKLGCHVLFRGPFGDFEHKPGRYCQLILFCQGTGIVPYLSIVRRILDDEKDETKIRMIYSAAGFGEILLKESLVEFSHFWNFSVNIFLTTNTDKKLIGPNLKVVNSRLTNEHIESEVDTENTDNIFVCLCGSKDYMNSILSTLQARGVKSENIYKF